MVGNDAPDPPPSPEALLAAEPPLLLPGAGSAVFRLLQRNDRELLLDFFHSHSAETIRQRYFVPLREIPGPQLESFLHVDEQTRVAVLAVHRVGIREEILGIGRYLKDPVESCAEIALTIHDRCQDHGIGTRLLGILIRLGIAAGLESFEAYYLADNTAMHRTLAHFLPRARPEIEDGISHLRFRLDTVLPPATKPLEKRTRPGPKSPT